MGLEARLYKSIEDFVYRHFGCHAVKQQVGTQFGKVDIMGLRETSGDFAAGGELIAIEVKEENAAFLTAIGQAFAYSLYAHRCYLAVRKRYGNKFTPDEIDIATQFGVGLIEIKNNKCNVILTSKSFAPQEKFILHILDKLNLFKCTICSGIYHQKDVFSVNQPGPIDLKKKSKYVGRLKDAIGERKNVRFWLYELYNLRKDKRAYVYDRRFICKDCVSIFASVIKNNR
jgi:hypothetical protein